ncbi:MAG: hypothetical protein ACQSGP_07295 [Frankia sp.]
MGATESVTQPVALRTVAPPAWTVTQGITQLGARTREALRRNPAFTVVFAGGLLIRLLATLAYRPALEFYGDSYSYLLDARTFRPSWIRPFGYPLLLRILSISPTIGIVPVIQHVAGLGTACAIYALLVHRGVSRNLATAGAAPLLLDAYQIQIEQMVMAETLFSALLAAAVIALCWSSRPSPGACGAAGLLLVMATLTRTTAIAFAGLAGVYLLARGAGWRGLRSFALAFAVPALGYVAWFHSVYGVWSMQTVDGAFLWGRVAPFANCRVDDLPAADAALCSPHPGAERPGPNFYDWDRNSLSFQMLRARPIATNTTLRAAAQRVILAQPIDYARVVATDTVHYFEPGRHTGPRDWYLGSWIFPTTNPPAVLHIDHPLVTFSGRWVPRRFVPVLGGFLRGYQRLVYTPGPFLALCGAVGATVAVRRTSDRRVRQECFLLVTGSLALVVLPSATAVFDYRYLLPTLVLLPPAGALGVTRLLRGGKGRISANPTGSARRPRYQAPVTPPRRPSR